MHTHAGTAGVPHGAVSVLHGNTTCVLHGSTAYPDGCCTYSIQGFDDHVRVIGSSLTN